MKIIKVIKRYFSSVHNSLFELERKYFNNKCTTEEREAIEKFALSITETLKLDYLKGSDRETFYETSKPTIFKYYNPLLLELKPTEEFYPEWTLQWLKNIKSHPDKLTVTQQKKIDTYILLLRKKKGEMRIVETRKKVLA